MFTRFIVFSFTTLILSASPLAFANQPLSTTVNADSANESSKVLAISDIQEFVDALAPDYGALVNISVGRPTSNHPEAPYADRKVVLHFHGLENFDQECIIRVTVTNNLEHFVAFPVQAAGKEKGKPRVACAD